MRVLAAVALFAAAPLIALLDLSTGLEVSFSIFYVIPPVVAGWYLGARLGIGVALLTGLSWAYAESVTRVASMPAAFWNRGTRVLVIIAFTYLVALVHRNQSELRRLLAQRDEFLSLVAHELRAPVAAIDIVATGLTRAAALSDPERHALDRLREQARGLTTLAESLLSVGRLEAGVGRLDPREFDLREMLITLAGDESRLEVTAPMSPVVVTADHDTIRRAIMNVVDNALKFSRPGDPVALELREDPGHATVRITDRGIGFDAADAQRLFRKYSRIRDTADVPGVGLGLYFTQLALEAHGGTVRAQSPGRGSGATFELRLPMRWAPSARSRTRDRRA